MFPVLNCNRVYKYSKVVVLVLKNNYHLSVSNDGWEILKYCDGTKDEISIYELIVDKNQLSKNDFDMFLQEAVNNNAIKYIEKVELINYEIIDEKYMIAPRSVSIELTSKCNLKCNYCYGEYSTKRNDFIKYDEIISLFDELYKIGVSVVELTGGEPLAHPNFKNILTHALNTFLRVNILTNGVLFTEEIINIMKEHKDKVFVQISIDGCTEETNFMIRGVKNTWKKTLNAIKYLKNNAINHRVAYMLTSENTHEIPSVCELFEKEGLKNLIFSPVVMFGRACDSKECALDNVQLEKIYKIAEQHKEIFRPYNINEKIERKNCGAGWQNMVISPTGSVRACLMLNENAIYGNIRHQKFSDICNSETVKLYQNFSKTEEECERCSYKDYCACCIVRIYAANIKRIKAGLYLCDVAKKNNMNKFLDFNSDFKFTI